MDEGDYQTLQIDILALIFQICAVDGSLWYQHKNRIKNGIQITPYEWLLKTHWLVKQEIVWFNGSQNFDKCRFYPMTERIYWLAKSAQTKFVNNINKHDDWHIQAEGTSGEHTRRFPEKLVKNIICCYPENVIIVDPLMGGGTTLRAAKDLGRRAIGVEIEEKYCEIAAKRLSQEVLQLG